MKFKRLLSFIGLAVLSISMFSVNSVSADSHSNQTYLSGEAKTVKMKTQVRTVGVDLILQNIKLSKVEVVNDDFEIYGNHSISERQFRDIVNYGSPKVYLQYRTNRQIDLPYDALLVIKTQAKSYSYEFIEKDTDNPLSILTGISSFVEKYADIINSGDYYAIESNIPMTLSSSIPTTFIDCVVEKEYVMRFDDKGYIIYHIAVSRYTANSKSIVFIVTVNNAFVPGIVAKKNNESGYDSYKNQEGYVHMTVEQAYDANEEYYYGRRWGNVPYKKDYWPINEPAVTTITSSLQAGVNLGYSFENGFSLDNISVSQNRNIGANISFGYSKAITRSEPALSVQVNSTNADKCEWYYTYSKDASETNHLSTNYMFEISNSRYGMLIGDFRLKLDYKFVVDKGFWFAAQTKYGSADLIVRAGELQQIYDFCSGMI